VAFLATTTPQFQSNYREAPQGWVQVKRFDDDFDDDDEQ
jgi:hypothetical protein